MVLRKRTGAIIAIVLGVGLFTAGPALAQQPAQQPAPQPLDAGHWTFTPMAGFVFGGDLEGGSLGLGAAAGYNWNSRVAFEAEFTLLPSIEQGVLLNVDSTVWNLTGNVLYNFGDRPTVPYLAAGLGIGRGSTDLDELGLDDIGLDDSSTELTVNLGGGIKRRFTDNASFRGDLRYFTGDDLVSDYLRLFAGVTFDLGER